MRINLLNKVLGRFGFSLKDNRIRPSIMYMKNKGKKSLNCIEIGTLYGDNALNMLKNMDVSKLYCIDPYEEYLDYSDDHSNKLVKKAESIAKKKLKNYSDKVRFIKEYSSKASKKLKKKSFDFIYVDGNHSYEYVKDDLRLYFPKLKKDGIMAGDDIGWPGVSKAVYEFAASKSHLRLIINEPDWILIQTD